MSLCSDVDLRICSLRLAPLLRIGSARRTIPHAGQARHKNTEGFFCHANDLPQPGKQTALLQISLDVRLNFKISSWKGLNEFREEEGTDSCGKSRD